MNSLKLLQDVNGVVHPLLKEMHLTRFIVEGLKKEELSLYEAFLLNNEAIQFERLAYIQLAWSKQVTISYCIKVLNQKWMAKLFGDKASENLMIELAKEASDRCAERRSHYIMDRYQGFLAMEPDDVELLNELYSVRKQYNSLSDSKGPFHVEFFPFTYCEVEKLFLDNAEIKLATEVADWMVELLSGLER